MIRDITDTSVMSAEEKRKASIQWIRQEGSVLSADGIGYKVKKMLEGFSIIPELPDIHAVMELTDKYGVAWEYNDFMQPQVYEDAAELRRRIAAYKALGRCNVKDTMHGAFLGLDIAANDSVIKSRSRELMKGSMDVAAEIGCRGVVFHTGLIGFLRLDYYLDNWLENAEEFYKDLCEKYPETYIYLENSFEQEPDIFVRLMERMKGVNNFKLCFDYGHAALTATSIEKWFEQLHPYIGHMHLNDNDGRDDLHMVPGEGVLDFNRWKQLVEKYDINAQVLLELNGCDRINAALEYMKRI